MRQERECVKDGGRKKKKVREEGRKHR